MGRDMSAHINVPSASDLAALEDVPASGWFEAESTLILRPRYRCDRLEASGLLESRVVGGVSSTRKEFRRLLSKVHSEK
jgi:hypothetical protein